MTFSEPLWLAAGFAGIILLIWMWQRYDARQQAALARFVSAHLQQQLTQSISRAGRRAQRGLFLTALICLFVALAGPLVGFRWEQVSRRGNEIIFAIDTSRSMLTQDVKPNRDESNSRSMTLRNAWMAMWWHRRSRARLSAPHHARLCIPRTRGHRYQHISAAHEHLERH